VTRSKLAIGISSTAVAVDSSDRGFFRRAVSSEMVNVVEPLSGGLRRDLVHLPYAVRGRQGSWCRGCDAMHSPCIGDGVKKVLPLEDWFGEGSTEVR
jgi:hypothetical protein